MSLAIGDIVELVCPDGAFGRRFGQSLGQAGGIFHIIVRILVGDRRDLDELGAKESQRVFLLLALGDRDDDDLLEAHGIANDGEADAGVAGGSFDNGAAWPQLTLGNRVLDDEQGGAVLDRLAGIHEYVVAENGASGKLGGLLQLDQGRVADRGDDIRFDIHDYSDRLKAREEPITVPTGPRKISLKVYWVSMLWKGEALLPAHSWDRLSSQCSR